MSAGFICDGCGHSVAGNKGETWVGARVRVANGGLIVDGDFCHVDCLARLLASDKLDKAIKKGEAR